MVLALQCACGALQPRAGAWSGMVRPGGAAGPPRKCLSPCVGPAIAWCRSAPGSLPVCSVRHSRPSHCCVLPCGGAPTAASCLGLARPPWWGFLPPPWCVLPQRGWRFPARPGPRWGFAHGVRLRPARVGLPPETVPLR